MKSILAIATFTFIFAACNSSTLSKDTKSHIFNFGTIKRGDSVIASFEIANKSESNIRIVNITTPCSCTNLIYDSTEIKPSQSHTFTVKYGSSRDTGSVSKSFIVETTDKKEKLRTYYLRGYVQEKQ